MKGPLDPEDAAGPRRSRRWAPALTLLILSPLVAEVLPGATRFSSIFVFPVEMCVWGGGAVMIRGAVRRWSLGWLNLVLLALALATAEECLIQQTSLAPLVVQLKGVGYARAYGVNYVYLLWALVYEAVWVVVVPVSLAELVFPDRRKETWLSKAGFAVVAAFFLLGCFLAWFSWTQIARTKVFHLPAYRPPAPAILIAVIAIGALVLAAIGPFRSAVAVRTRPRKPPPSVALGIAAALWAVLWYGLVLLAFGIDPAFSPGLAVGAGVVLTAGMLLFLPRWVGDPRWDERATWRPFSADWPDRWGSAFLDFLGGVPPRISYSRS